ncbi:MAG TPA: hypothetical protein VFW94_23565 [Candidatus Acidoferrales bacterium]|nr:hypothetical protein [Candidatus Acidoferrales bacterium]
MSKLIKLAQARGSTATTRGGAMRWLKAHLGHPHPGLVATTADAPLIGRCYVCGAREWEPCRVSPHAPLAQGMKYHPTRKRSLRLIRTARDARDLHYNRRGARALKRFGLLAKDEAEAWAAALTRPLIPAVDYPYRMSDSPGSFGFHVAVGDKPRLSVDTGNEWGKYSKSCRYPATSQHVLLTVSVMTLQLFPSLTVVGKDRGTRLVIDAAPCEGGFRLVWGEQSRGLRVREAHGYLIGGHLIEMDSLEMAQKVWQHIAVKNVTRRLAGKSV